MKKIIIIFGVLIHSMLFPQCLLLLNICLKRKSILNLAVEGFQRGGAKKSETTLFRLRLHQLAPHLLVGL